MIDLRIFRRLWDDLERLELRSQAFCHFVEKFDGGDPAHPFKAGDYGLGGIDPLGQLSLGNPVLDAIDCQIRNDLVHILFPFGCFRAVYLKWLGLITLWQKSQGLNNLLDFVLNDWDISIWIR